VGGATNLGHYVDVLGPRGAGLRIAGLYDEAETLRALGVDAVLRILEKDGEAGRFRTFQRQPAQRGRQIEAHLRRFLGIKSGRKIRYGRLLVERSTWLVSPPRSTPF
jgi:hypothetical protein